MSSNCPGLNPNLFHCQMHYKQRKWKVMWGAVQRETWPPACLGGKLLTSHARHEESELEPQRQQNLKRVMGSCTMNNLGAREYRSQAAMSLCVWPVQPSWLKVGDPPTLGHQVSLPKLFFFSPIIWGPHLHPWGVTPECFLRRISSSLSSGGISVEIGVSGPAFSVPKRGY